MTARTENKEPVSIVEFDGGGFAVIDHEDNVLATAADREGAAMLLCMFQEIKEKGRDADLSVEQLQAFLAQDFPEHMQDMREWAEKKLQVTLEGNAVECDKIGADNIKRVIGQEDYDYVLRLAVESYNDKGSKPRIKKRAKLLRKHPSYAGLDEFDFEQAVKDSAIDSIIVNICDRGNMVDPLGATHSSWQGKWTGADFRPIEDKLAELGADVVGAFSVLEEVDCRLDSLDDAAGAAGELTLSVKAIEERLAKLEAKLDARLELIETPLRFLWERMLEGKFANAAATEERLAKLERQTAIHVQDIDALLDESSLRRHRRAPVVKVKRPRPVIVTGDDEVAV